MTKTDAQLKRDIVDELHFDPRINDAQIGVSVDNGAVFLMGTVDSYAERWAAEDAAKRVGGVLVVAQDLMVKILASHQHIDPEIASAVLSALRWNVWVPKTVTARVQKGRVTLEGQVEWNYQRESAQRAVRDLSGVVSVNDDVRIELGVPAAQVKDKVQVALQRQATADANTIQVHTSGGKVTLSGTASCWHVVDDAASAAWAIAGVTEVVKNVSVSER